MPSISKDLAVRLLTIIATPIIAGLTAIAAKKGVQLPNGDVVTLSVLAGVAVLGAGFHWLQRQPVVLKGEEDLDRLAAKVHALLANDPVASAAVQDLGDQLKAHTDQIITAIGTAVHAPVSVQDVTEQLAQAVLNQQKPPASSAPTTA